MEQTKKSIEQMQLILNTQPELPNIEPITINLQYSFIGLNDIIKLVGTQKTYAKGSGQNAWGKKKKQIETDLRCLFLAQGMKYGQLLFDGKYEFHFILWRTPSCRWDLDNKASGVSKLFFDALKDFGAIKDDNYQTVAKLSYSVQPSKVAGMTVEIKKI